MGVSLGKERGSVLFTRELKPSLTEGTCLMQTGRKNTETSHKEKNGNYKTQPRAPLVPLFRGASSGAPGLLVAPESAAPFALPACPTLGTFSQHFHDSFYKGLRLLIFCCSSLERRSWGCSSSREEQELENQGGSREGCGICSLTPTLGCLALQMCRRTHTPPTGAGAARGPGAAGAVLP